LEQEININVSAMAESNQNQLTENLSSVFEEALKGIKVLSINDKDIEATINAANIYEGKIQQIEIELAKKMKEIFASCKNQEEMIESVIMF
jgi:YbbR domain-containing protein